MSTFPVSFRPQLKYVCFSDVTFLKLGLLILQESFILAFLGSLFKKILLPPPKKRKKKKHFMLQNLGANKGVDY